jgi:hypothetical protein
MSSGACAATLPLVSEPSYIHSGNLFSKSLPVSTKKIVSTKTIIRKFITTLTNGKTTQQHTNTSKKKVDKTVSEVGTKTEIVPTRVPISTRLPIYPSNPKSRERTFDLLTLVPASPRSVMAPPPSPAVHLVRKRVSHFDKINKLNNPIDPEELEMDFFFSDSLAGKPGNEDDDDDNSSLGELLDCDGGEEQNEFYFDNNSESFYDDEEMNTTDSVTICDEENVTKIDQQLTSELLTSQSLGPHLNEAFDLVRMIEFDGPWISPNKNWPERTAVDIRVEEVSLVDTNFASSTENEDEVSNFNFSKYILFKTSKKAEIICLLF